MDFSPVAQWGCMEVLGIPLGCLFGVGVFLGGLLGRPLPLVFAVAAISITVNGAIFLFFWRGASGWSLQAGIPAIALAMTLLGMVLSCLRSRPPS